MPLHLTKSQRQQILRFVAKHSPFGDAFHIPDGLFEMAGADLGYALLTLEGEGLCWTEEPDIVGSTPEGLAALAGRA